MWHEKNSCKDFAPFHAQHFFFFLNLEAYSGTAVATSLNATQRYQM